MPFLAEQFAQDLGLRPTDLFSYQFALAPEDGHAIEGFRTRALGTRHLHHCPKLQVATLLDQTGQEVGFCLGIAVDAKGVLVADGRMLDCNAGWEPFWEEIERFAIGLAGRWLVIITDGGETRIYGDASGLYNCVYDPVSGAVGSTLLVSLLRNIEESAEVDYTRTLSEGMRLPFGRTRDRHARRLGVNHYLRLEDWSETRFWPKPGAFVEVAEGEEVKTVEQIKNRLSAVFSAIVTNFPSAVGVSGGNDSRNLVAAGKTALSHVSRFYTHTRNFNSRTDFRSAKLMMEALGYPLEHHPAASQPYTDDEIALRNKRFQRSTGYCVGLHQTTNVKFAASPPPGELILLGNVMEALRAAHWKSHSHQRRNALKFGLRRCLFVGGASFNGAFVRQWLPEYKKWHAGLPEDARRRFIDLVFPEHYLPNLGASLYSAQDNYVLCPFNDRKTIALCGRLPVSYRYSNHANRDFLSLAAPELLDVPYATDIRRGRQTAESAFPSSKNPLLEDAT